MLSITDSCRYQSITRAVAVLLHVNPICFCDSLSNRISSLAFLVTSCGVRKTYYEGNNIIKSIPLRPIFVMLFFAWKTKRAPPKQISELGVIADLQRQRGCGAPPQPWGAGWPVLHPLPRTHLSISSLHVLHARKFA